MTDKKDLSQDTTEMNKTELKAYHQAIRAFYLENGWKDTLSAYKLSPKQGSEILPQKVKDQRKKVEKEAKASERAAAKAKRKAAKSKAPEKNKAPKKAKPKSKIKVEVKEVAAKTRRKGKKAPKVDDVGSTLDYLLAVRRQRGMVTIDDVIIGLTEQIRSA